MTIGRRAQCVMYLPGLLQALAETAISHTKSFSMYENFKMRYKHRGELHTRKLTPHTHTAEVTACVFVSGSATSTGRHCTHTRRIRVRNQGNTQTAASSRSDTCCGSDFTYIHRNQWQGNGDMQANYFLRACHKLWEQLHAHAPTKNAGR